MTEVFIIREIFGETVVETAPSIRAALEIVREDRSGNIVEWGERVPF